MKFFMGIDVSTTGSKALIIDSDGSVIGVQSSPHAHIQPPAVLVRAGSGGLVAGGP